MLGGDSVAVHEKTLAHRPLRAARLVERRGNEMMIQLFDATVRQDPECALAGRADCIRRQLAFRMPGFVDGEENAQFRSAFLAQVLNEDGIVPGNAA